MSTQKKQHSVRLPLDMEAAFNYTIQKMTRLDATMNKNDIMVKALEDMVMTQLLKEFSVEEATQFINGAVPESLKSPILLDWRPI